MPCSFTKVTTKRPLTAAPALRRAAQPSCSKLPLWTVNLRGAGPPSLGGLSHRPLQADHTLCEFTRLLTASSIKCWTQQGCGKNRIGCYCRAMMFLYHAHMHACMHTHTHAWSRSDGETSLTADLTGRRKHNSLMLYISHLSLSAATRARNTSSLCSKGTH